MDLIPEQRKETILTDAAPDAASPIDSLEEFGAAFLTLHHTVYSDEVQTSQWQPGQSPNVSKDDSGIRAKYSTSDPVWVAVADDRRWELRSAVQAGERALTAANRLMKTMIAALEALQTQSETSEP